MAWSSGALQREAFAPVRCGVKTIIDRVNLKLVKWLEAVQRNREKRLHQSNVELKKEGKLRLRYCERLKIHCYPKPLKWGDANVKLLAREQKKVLSE